MQQTLIGTPFPILQQAEQDYDYQRGYLYRFHYESTDQVLMQQLQRDWIAAGVACRFTLRPDGRAVLDVDDSTQQWTLDTWQLDGQTEQVSWLLNPFIQEVFNFNYPTVINGKTITPENAQNAVAQHLASGDNQTVTFADPILAPLVGSEVYYFYQWAEGGATAYRNDADGVGYVLRHSTNVSNQYQTNVADFGTGNIYTTGQLLSEVSDSGLWINPLSERLQFKIAHLVQPPFRENWTIGWLKGRSTENYAANNRDDIVTTYTFGQWANALYEPY